MAVVIRLKRVGGRNQPYFRVVVADSRFPRDGRFIENLGDYDPTKGQGSARIKRERARYWMEQGAVLSETVKGIFKKLKV